VLSIERAHAAVIACFAGPQALDALPAQPGTHNCRVAPDELLLVAPLAMAGDTERRATEHLAAAEPDALVVDQSDGWCVFTLRGDEADNVFAQLSTVPLPAHRPAFLQGAFAGGSAKFMACDGYIDVFVPSTLRHHVASRLQDVCRGRTDVAALRDALRDA
jgi:sarcosine oxidase gamma subunit